MLEPNVVHLYALYNLLLAIGLDFSSNMVVFDLNMHLL